MRQTWATAGSSLRRRRSIARSSAAGRTKSVSKLTNGLSVLAKQRKVDVLRGEAVFIGPYSLELRSGDGARRVDFKQCIIAAGSESVRLPRFPDDPRIIDSTGALELPEEGKAASGGGRPRIIGLEMACVYDALGSTVSVVELSDGSLPGTDRDLVRPLQKRIEKRYARSCSARGVSKLEPHADGLRATFEGPGVPAPQDFDRVLVAVGRSANGNAHPGGRGGRGGRQTWDHRRGSADAHQRAAYLCHRRYRRATHAGAQGHPRSQGGGGGGCRSQILLRRHAAFRRWRTPILRLHGWASPKPRRKHAASTMGRACFRGRPAAARSPSIATKGSPSCYSTRTRRVIGGGIVGTNAGELIAEVGLANRAGGGRRGYRFDHSCAPTLSETVAFSAEAFEGTLTDLYIPKR